MHRLRIAGKQSRYALEFFQSLYRPKRVQAYLEALTGLQDELGRHNDLIVADTLLEQLEQEQPQQAGAIAFVRGYLLARRDGDQVGVRKLWKAFQALDLPV
ncbi:CHAD domain-containing protein, partial [Rugamonas sp.]|uniref:CHAD domain-containing protein n=1 Tax=Rugamonas sp. TaxID=1926287 RepID=UPI00345B75EC